MKKRRELTGPAGLGSVGGSTGAEAAKSTNPQSDLPQAIDDYEENRVQHVNMSGFAAPKISTVGIGIIGMGHRGPSLLETMRLLGGVEIKALCDLCPARTKAAKEQLMNTGHSPDLYAGSAEEWQKLCQRKDIDLVIVTTPWYMHAEMAIYAMEHGKHVASEIPAASTIQGCWQLVETAERTKKHCIMLENYAYMPFQLLTLSMARQGFFGEVVHGEGAYNTSKMGNNFNTEFYWNMWWLRQYASRKGNVYPTHGLGSIAQIMDINRGDKFDFLVSVESKDFMMGAHAKRLAKRDGSFKEFVGKDYRGNMSTTIIKTTQGRTIMLQHDATSPSPHNLIHGVYGTKGAALLDPPPARICKGNHSWASAEEYAEIKEKYTPELDRKMAHLAGDSGHGGSDLKEAWRLIDCLHNGLPLDQDVYDAAAWSSILPLTDWSVRNNSSSIKVPDFTAGSWKTNERNMDIALEKGGGNTEILR